MPASIVKPASAAFVAGPAEVEEPAGLITQRYPAIGRYVEHCRQELRQGVPPSDVPRLDVEISDLMVQGREAMPEFDQA